MHESILAQGSVGGGLSSRRRRGRSSHTAGTIRAMEQVTIGSIDPALTLKLRQQVLRPNLRTQDMAFGDEGQDTGVFGARNSQDGEVVSTGLVRREAPEVSLDDVVPVEALANPWRLRGMATREDLRGTGIGSGVLQACVDHVAKHGGGLLWCNARTGAARFYKRAGFVEWGEKFVSFDVEHIVMWRLVDAVAPEED
jgi:predicted GNAT family N-acyltransferase